jgi:hypothetical protein
MSDKTPPIEGQLFEAVPEENLTEYNWATGRRFTDNIDEALLITSKVLGSDQHKILLDIDIPAQLIPSSTPGHAHLYIDQEISWAQLEKLLTVLAEMKVIEKGYAGASIERGYTALRLPWVSKVVPNADR